jgi:hypothetical protein
VTDRDIRDVERRAKCGDIDAALEYFRLANRTSDVFLQYDALKTLANAQNPDLLAIIEAGNKGLESFLGVYGDVMERHLRAHDETFFFTARTRESLERLIRLIDHPPS